MPRATWRRKLRTFSAACITSAELPARSGTKTAAGTNAGSRNGFSYSAQRDERRSGVYPIFHGVAITVMVISVSKMLLRRSALRLRACLRQQGIIFVP